MSKHYLVKDSSKPVKAQGRTFTFDPADYFEPTHSWWGIFKATAQEDIEALDEAVAVGQISVISAAEFAQYELKKKTAKVSKNFIEFGTRHSPQQSAPSGRPAVAVDEAPRPSVTTAALENLEDVLTVRPININIGKARK